MTYRNRIVGHGEESPEQLLANPKNWRIHPRSQEEALAGVLSDVGWVATVLVNRQTGFVVDGHLRVAHAISKGEAEVPVTYLDLTEDEENKVLATFDPLAAIAGTDRAKLDELLADIATDDAGLDDLLDSLRAEPDVPIEKVQPGPTLSDRFIVPPFSVLDARQGYWQERKRQWLALGIQSELGRGDTPRSSARAAPGEEPTYRQIKGSDKGLLGKSEQARSHYAIPSGSLWPAATVGPDGKIVRGDGRGRKLGETYATGVARGGGGMSAGMAKQADSRAIKDHAWQATHLARPQAKIQLDHGTTWVAGVSRTDEVSGKNLAAQPQSGTSIFDPVLCELVYRWFSPPDGKILDPMAGGSVRGIVASKLGRAYTGVELRPEQVAANEAQRNLADEPNPVWITGDAANITDLAQGEYDLVFTCPPYADLERYSDDLRDLSTMDYPDFLTAWRGIVQASTAMLREDRFAAVVVGDIRDPKGMYRGLIPDTIAAFADAGLALYNEAILVTAVGSLPIRVGKQFSSSRKLGKTHQNVLVFVKGDPRKATKACGDVEVELSMTEEYEAA